jgi:hypothetical protein
VTFMDRAVCSSFVNDVTNVKNTWERAEAAAT